MSDISPTCPACATAGASWFITDNNCDMFRCGRCGTLFVSPPPLVEDTDKIYTDAYHGATSGYFAKVEKKLRRSAGRVRKLKRYVRGGRFLDVGCNGGFMVQAAREAGFDAFGIDIDAVSIAYAREHYGAHFETTHVEEFATRGGSFDLIYCSEVVEHVPQPLPFLAAIAAVLAPGGYLFITTPDVGHWRVPCDIRRWDAFSPPWHCTLFTEKGLRAGLARSGFEIVRRLPAFKPGIKLFVRRA
jgi:SAM-dependent methyltransferase